MSRYFSLIDAFRPAPPKARKAPPVGAFSVNDAGSPEAERNDCSVRAMSLTTGRPYKECQVALYIAGRMPGKGCKYAVLSEALGLEYQSLVSGGKRQTAAKFIREHPKGKYIVFVTGHFFALVDGVQLDSHRCLYRPRSRVWGYWRVA